MRTPLLLGMLALSASMAHGVIIDTFDAVPPSVNHPEGAGVAGTYYDITSDAFASIAGGTLAGSPALRILDGGFTNGVYVIYSGVVPADGLYTLSLDMDIDEAGGLNGVRAYQVGVVVNGAHRAANPSDLPAIDPNAPGQALANYPLTLTDGDDNANAIVTLTTGEFTASAGDSLLIAFSTDVTSGNYDLNSGTWGASAVVVDNIALNVVPEPASLSLLGLGALAALRRRRA